MGPYQIHKTGSTDVEGVSRAVESTMLKLGKPLYGRKQRLVEILVPHVRAAAPARSISKSVGLGEMAFHTDGCHRITIPKFLVFGAVIGVDEVPLEVKVLDVTRVIRDYAHVLKPSVLSVRSGRMSFYRSAITSDGSLCFDPYCMEPANAHAKRSIGILQDELEKAETLAFYLKSGEVLVIDNRVCFHRRPAAYNCDRILVRGVVR